jgi:hypothetical protein
VAVAVLLAQLARPVVPAVAVQVVAFYLDLTELAEQSILAAVAAVVVLRERQMVLEVLE